MPVNATKATETTPQWAAERARYEERISQLEHQLAWFQRQLFGEKWSRKSEQPDKWNRCLMGKLTTLSVVLRISVGILRIALVGEQP